MRTMTMVLSAASVLAAGLPAQDQESRPASRPPTPKERVAAIEDSIHKARVAFFELYKKATTDEEKQELFEEKYPKPEGYVGEMFEIAKSDPKGEGAEAALVWIVQNDPRGKRSPEALEVLLRDHLASKQLGVVADALGDSNSPKAADFLKALEARSPHRDVKGRALYAIANQKRYATRMAEWLKEQKDQKLLDRVTKDMGAEEVAALRKLDVTASEKEIETVLEQVKERYADVDAAWGGTLGDRAGGDLFEIRNLAVGMVAPEIEGEDIDGTPMKLSEFRGKVVVLDFWGNW
jgi:hypothetical protein